MKVLTTAIGYPYMGEKREFKFLMESFWKGETSKENFLKGAEELMRNNLNKQSAFSLITLCDSTFYDRMLDLSVAYNLIPARFRGISDDLERYYAMARGKGAMEMTKWFNTNYHYLVPEFEADMEPKLNDKYFVDMFKRNNGTNTKVTLIGPYTYVKLAKGVTNFNKSFKTISDLFVKLANNLVAAGVEYIQIEEPALVMDIPKADIKLVQGYLSKIKGAKVILVTYFDSVTHYKETVSLPVWAIGLDFVSNTENLSNVKKLGFPKGKVLMAGMVNGRNIWATDLNAAVKTLSTIVKKIKPETLIISSSCSMQHSPVTTKFETKLPLVLKNALAFADEKIEEILTLKKAIANGVASVSTQLSANAKALKEIKTCSERNLKDVAKKLKALKLSDFKRSVNYIARKKIHTKEFSLPLFPTTTIGSFPQTEEVRHNRAQFRKGLLSEADYKKFIQDQIKYVVNLQEEIGLDVLVHGEFERTDMVEFFGEKLSGFATSLNGWVVSYGSRCVKPPMIWADAKRMRSMTTDEITFAQSLTKKPMKGMLTGPITIINWSFVRDDISRKDVANQIGLALAEEVLDLESKGIKMIQIDEAALQEGAPIKLKNKPAYYDFSVKAFRLCSAKVKASTQIHTHMCYSNFNEIIKSIDAMDADVISIENSRSKGELLDIFKKFNYKKDIGPGTYDIHSPAIPTVEEMVGIINTSKKHLKISQLWVNPDCGLKTRGYTETIPALKNMVQAAKVVRVQNKA